MLAVIGCGTIAGVALGLVRAVQSRASDSGGSGGARDGNDAPSTSSPAEPWWRKQPRVAAAMACAVGVTVAAAGGTLGLRHQKRRRRNARRGKDGRIPLQDLVRFKERQWFVEELENSRDGDPNAMLRLAKMYLHGQGCQRSIGLAQEWLRKARYHGLGASLDELYATEDPDPRGRLRQLIAREEQRRAARRAAGTPGAPAPAAAA